MATLAIIAAGIARETIGIQLGIPAQEIGWEYIWLDHETNLPSWYSTVLLLAASALLAIQYQFARARGDRKPGSWLALSLVMLYLSIDEGSQAHERFGDFLKTYIPTTDLLYFTWVIVGGPLIVLAAIGFIPFLFRLPRSTALLFVASGLIFVAGGFGFELIGGRMVTYTGWGSPYYMVAALFEEILELIGMTLFVTSLLRHLARDGTAITLRFR